MNHHTAWIVSLECQGCQRSGKKLILAPSGTIFRAGCVICQRTLRVSAEYLFVSAGFLVVRIKEYI